MLGYLVDPQKQFMSKGGDILVGGHLEVYLVGTDDRAVTYSDFVGTLNPADITLDANGRAVVVADSDMSYRVEVYSASGALQWTVSPALVGGGSFVAVDGKADKVNGATEGHLASLTENGDIEDSGYAPDDFASKEEFDDLTDEVDGKADKDNVVTDVTWDSATRKIKKTIDGEDVDIVQVQQSIDQNDSRPINSKAVKDEKYISVKEQSWTDLEKSQARQNINAIEGGDFLPRGDVVWGKVLQISLFDSILSVSDARRTQSGYIAPVAQDTDRGKAAFVTQGERGNELVYRFILENCDTNAKVIAAVQNGQIPYHAGSAGKYLPYIVADNGDMYLYNVFGVLDNNPMTGDALGISLRKRVYNGNIIDECYWGKPYGLNYIEVAECKCNNNYHLGVGNETIMAWRRIPMDRDMVITAFSLIGKTATVKKAMMVGIFEVDGASVTNVSASSTWTEDSGYYYNDMENAVRLQDIITSGSGAYPFVTFSLSEPLTLHAGKNYLFPCRFNDDNTYNDPWVYTYKRAVPAMPWEDLVRNTTENGDPVMSTALPCCKPSALYVRLASGAEMWI